ncbi:dihydrofolate reductase family protein [Fodinibius salsisoli]|uniref:Dihydrofolate reductase n=1 Tax=Fodinibius salsisoli TaxID=2820877 RepID=A0ABT3PK32_9BACT|nr:dihydrofolate reductase family protein [Fodinibius salsisoli]MCW9705534.1 dihydrofolate reductase [Fodinibius salsisoli]
MRKIIYAQLVSADGYIEDDEGKIDWTEPGETLHRHFNELEKSIAINFYGRRMSETMDYWLTADQNPDLKDYEREYARLWQNTQRMVFSKTLDKVEGKARLLREVDPEEITKLKSKPGKNMAVGGANLASTFIKYGLIDEFRLYIHPIVLGKGKPMFPENANINLELLKTQTFPRGVVLLQYQPKH